MEKYFWSFLFVCFAATIIGTIMCYIGLGLLIISLCVVIATFISFNHALGLGIFFYWCLCLMFVIVCTVLSKNLRNGFIRIGTNLANR